MKNTIPILCMGLFAWHFPFADVSHEIVPGAKIYDSFGDLEGQLVFVSGRMAKGGKSLPPARVMTYDLVSKRTTEVLQVPQPAHLSVSCDGTWGAVVLTDINLMAPAEVLLFSLNSRETRHLRYPSVEIQVVIVADQMFVRTGTFGNHKVEVYDIATGARAKLSLSKGPPAESEDYFFVATRFADSKKVFMGYNPGDAANGLREGLYAYGIGTHMAERIGESIDFYDYSITGEAVLWETITWGSTLTVYKSLVHNLRNGREPEGRVLYRERFGASNLAQLSPCRRFAVLEQRYVGKNGLECIYYLCDLQSGKRKLFVEAKADKIDSVAFVGDVHWVRKSPQAEQGTSLNK